MPDAVAAQSAGIAASSSAIRRIPTATYRVQLRAGFGLRAVLQLLPYLRDLGISDVYLSPLFKAREESAHGYDVVDHSTIDPAFGTLEDFRALAEAVRDAGMGILLDVVPNHMGINDAANRWWTNVLENGPTAEHADCFDIDWQPAAAQLHNKVLLPFLGVPFGEALEGGQLTVVVEDERPQLAYGPKRYPLARATWPEALSRALRRGGEFGAGLKESLADLNGRPGEPRSFDALERMLDAQWYRLAYWRVAADEINYRRFFDINDLAAIRVELPHVFQAVHALVARFFEQGWVTGLRIDHPDGLLDPEAYFQNLQALYREHRADPEAGDSGAPAQIYVVAEKILSGDERLPAEWAVSGTTGYDFMNLVNRLFVDAQGLAALRERYPEMTGESQTSAEVAYASKREVLVNALASELNMLAGQLVRIAQQHRASRDFTRRTLERALRELIACLPVYRTYVRPRGWEVGEADYRHVTTAARLAKRRNAGLSHAAVDFLAGVLRLENPPTLTADEADERRRFVLKAQQVTGPAMAKGLEDTAFYRYYPLASMNEVGGELDARGLEADDFHRLMARRLADWPHAMSASGTHDTKRGEDVRARLHVLSEMATDWIGIVERWHVLSKPMLVDVDGEGAPDRNDLYLLYQTLVGTWQTGRAAAGRDDYTQRILAYMHKALREAKRRTSWMNPSAEYEDAVAQMVRGLLVDDRGAAFRVDLEQLVLRIEEAGYVTGLSQTLLKIVAPGVPDFYQGTEDWDFNLVDPDNRRPVDFAARRQRLGTLQQAFGESPVMPAHQRATIVNHDTVKQYVIWRSLATRRERPDLFAHGEYAPLAASGTHADRLFGMARRLGDQWIAVVMPRLIQCMPRLPETRPGESTLDWQDTILELPADVSAWRNEFTFQSTPPVVLANELLKLPPVALLTSQSP